MKTALVTGANRGIGFEIARELSRLGFAVILSGRNEESVRKAAGKLAGGETSVSPLVMDVADPESIRSAFASLSASTKRLDVLVNNAGILPNESASILQTTPADFHKTLGTNALGPLIVTQTFLPLLSRGSRVVNVSSQAGEIGDGMSSYAPLYSISKTALNAVTCQLAHALRSKGIAVNAVCPGWVRTTMGGLMAPRSTKKGAETPVWLATEAPIGETGKFWRDKHIVPW